MLFRSLEDALNGIVIEDDRWTWRLVGEKMEPDANGARLVVFVRPIAAPAPVQPDLIPTTPADQQQIALHGMGEPEF